MPPGRQNEDRIDRRSLLKFTGGAAVTASIAGCLGGDDSGNGDDGNGDDANGDNGSSDQENGTETEDSTPDEEPSEGGELTVGFEAELTGLDPHLTSSVVSWVVNYNICETLITFEDGEPVGRLASDWSISEDGTEYTFTLKEGVMFHPPVEREMVADDVVYSFERMNQEEAKGSDLAELEGVEATGDYEVTFTLSRAFSPFLNFLARVPWVVVPQEAVEEQGGGLGDFQEPVGTGPFVFDEYEQGNFLRLVSFDDYRAEDVPLLDSVRVQPIPDPDSRVAALQSGDIDMARQVPGRNAGQLEDSSDTSIIQQRGTGWAQLHINCAREPWDDPAVRRAVAHVINRSDVVDAGVSGYGRAAWQPYPEESIWHYDLGDARRERDVDRAMEILEEAGNPLEGHTLGIKSNTSYAVMETTADLLVAELNAAGIDAETEVIEWGTQLEDFVTGSFDAMAFSVPFKIDPDRHYFDFIHPDGSQFNSYTEDQPDAQRMYDLIEEGRTNPNQDARVEAYTELEELINKNVPWVSVALTDDLIGLRSDVGGYESWLLPYSRWWTMFKQE
jgi:peptide/nickel transport system substrate-binding protein